MGFSLPLLRACSGGTVSAALSAACGHARSLSSVTRLLSSHPSLDHNRTSSGLVEHTGWQQPPVRYHEGAMSDREGHLPLPPEVSFSPAMPMPRSSAATKRLD
jgi:hypothetical protein